MVKILLKVALPKSVQSSGVGLTSRLRIGFPLPNTFISCSVPVPCIEKLKGFSSLSLFTIEIEAVLRPVADGLKETLKKVDPPAATDEAGSAVTAKSAA